MIPSGGEAKNYYFEYAGGNLIINRRSITAVVLSASSYVYNGGIKRPGVTVKCGATILVNNRDYTCSNVGGKVVGQYKVTVNCKGNYTGSKTAYFSLNPKGTKLSKLTKKKKSFTAKWKKQTANMGNGKINGYQIQCSLKKNFASGNKTVTVGDVKKTSRTVKGVKAKKTYYVRIRTYKKVGGKTFYSPWSGVKKVKTK